jgi:hypothetical protein
VLDAVLLQRLEGQRREAVAGRVGSDVPRDLEALAEPQGFEVEVVAHEVELVVDADTVAVVLFGVEHVAQHVRKPEQRGLGGIRVLAPSRSP